MASMQFDSLSMSCFFFAFVLPMGRPAVDVLDNTMSADSDEEVSDSLDREDGDVTDIVNPISLSNNSIFSPNDALDTLIFRAFSVMSIPFACSDAIVRLYDWLPFDSLLPLLV